MADEKKAQKDRELYLECLGHFMGMEFEPKTGFKPKQRSGSAPAGLRGENGDADPPAEAGEVEGSSQSQQNVKEEVFNVEGLNTENAKTWKPGAVTATLKKFGIAIQPHKKRTWQDFVLKGPDPPPPPHSKPAGSSGSNQSIYSSCVPVRKTLGGKPENFHQARVARDQYLISKPFQVPILGWENAAGQGEKRLKLEDSNIGDNGLPVRKVTVGQLFSKVTANRNKDEDNSSSHKSSSDRKQGSEDVVEVVGPPKYPNAFLSAKEKLAADDNRKGIKRKLSSPNRPNKPQPTDGNASNEEEVSENPELDELMSHKQIKVFEKKIVEAILSEVMEAQQETNWDDIAGLKGPKNIIREIIIWPMLRPDIFTGLRASPKGILLFGPPGTGKTMIGRLIATQSKSTFFNISASSLTSKWIGDGEKMVRCLFQVARIKQPSVIFIDEIDSILTQRSDTEHESSRRLKTEFLIQFDGCGTKQEDRILVIGVTNRPQELDEAARRRLVKRVYIPLPDPEGRMQIVRNLMKGQNFNLSEEDVSKIGDLTQGYSGADMKSLCQEASYGPIRDVCHMLENIEAANVRPIELSDFVYAVKRVKSSVADKDLEIYEDWDHSFGCHVSQ